MRHPVFLVLLLAGCSPATGAVAVEQDGGEEVSEHLGTAGQGGQAGEPADINSDLSPEEPDNGGSGFEPNGGPGPEPKGQQQDASGLDGGILEAGPEGDGDGSQDSGPESEPEAGVADTGLGQDAGSDAAVEPDPCQAPGGWAYDCTEDAMCGGIVWAPCAPPDCSVQVTDGHMASEEISVLLPASGKGDPDCLRCDGWPAGEPEALLRWVGKAGSGRCIRVIAPEGSVVVLAWNEDGSPAGPCAAVNHPLTGRCRVVRPREIFLVLGLGTSVQPGWLHLEPAETSGCPFDC